MEHLIELHGEWSVWRDFVLRGAGFPVRLVRELSAPECGALADRWQREAATARAEALAALEAAIASSDEQTAPLARKARRKLVTSRAGIADALRALEGRPPFQRALTASKAADGLRDELVAAYQKAEERVTEVLTAMLHEPRFRCALLWQNHAAVRRLDAVLRPDRSRDRHTRKAERLLARYLARYSTKNDTIGFFGPFVWGEISEEPPPIEVHAGAGLISERRAYLEHWPLAMLATALAARPEFAPHLVARLTPVVRLEGNVLHLMMGTETLSDADAALLSRIDGRRSVRELTTPASSTSAAPQQSPGELVAALERFKKNGWVRVGLPVPTDHSPYEQGLSSVLESIGDPELRAGALQTVAELVRARDAVLEAGMDPDRVANALDGLDATFTAATDRPATHRSGEMYAARTLVHHDAIRDVQVRLGASTVRALGGPLSLLLDGVRWLSHRMANAYAKELTDLFAAIRGDRERVPLPQFWGLAQRLFPLKGTTGGTASVSQLWSEYQRTWAELLGTQQEVSRVELRSEDLRDRVQQAFQVAGAGWPAARCHAPDVMVAAASADAIGRGDFFFVLGELHVFVNTLECDNFRAGHPSPERLDATVRAEHPDGRVTYAALGSNAIRQSNTPRSSNPQDVCLEVFFDGIASTPASQTLRVGDLAMEVRSGKLLVVSCKDGRTWDGIEFLNPLLLLTHTLLPPDATHLPRVTIDKLVVCRETWRVRPSDVDFLDEARGLERWLAVRRWAGRVGLPRLCFFKAASERKPMFLDLDSPVYVDDFVDVVRREAELAKGKPERPPIGITEMLPAPEQCWLVDAEGAAYTSEFRFAVSDRRPLAPR